MAQVGRTHTQSIHLARSSPGIHTAEHGGIICVSLNLGGISYSLIVHTLQCAGGKLGNSGGNQCSGMF